RALRLGEPLVPFNVACAVTLEHAAQLAALQPPVQRALAGAFGVQALADRICPVERADGTVSILARAEYVGADQADAVERIILQAGWRLSDPSRCVLPAALLLEL